MEFLSEDVVSKGILAVEGGPGKMQVGRLRTVPNGLQGPPNRGRPFYHPRDVLGEQAFIL
jgi:hypothetical protein